jgi:hypothetical protein
MRTRSTRISRAVAGALTLAFVPVLMAADIGQVKVVKGQVSIERDGQTVPATVAMRLRTLDTVKTGADGSIGINMSDNSLLSLGPNSSLSLDRYEFDATTQQGGFDTSLQKGSLAVVSGRIAKQSPEAMTVRTPFSVLGVRGTEFVVSADDGTPIWR